MQLLKHFFLFDLRSAGIAFYVPLLVWLISLIMILKFGDDPATYYSAFIVIQGIYIPFCCWHVIFRYNEVLQMGAQDTLSPYYRKWVVFDVIRYSSIYLIGLILLVATVWMTIGDVIFTLINLVHFPILLIFYVLVGLAAILYLKSVEVALTVISIYTVTEVITQGTFMPWPRIFFFVPPMNDFFSVAKVMLLFLSLFLFVFLIKRKI